MSIEKPDSNDKISDVLNISPPLSPIIRVDPAPLSPDAETPPEHLDAQKDFEEVRGNLKSLIDTVNTAVEGIAEVAAESDESRAYEVLADLVRTALEANNKLLDIHKKKKDIKAPPPGPANITKQTINITSSELLKMLKQKSETDTGKDGK